MRRYDQNFLELFWMFIQRSERRLIRLMVLACVALVLIQMSKARDPVQFYMAIAQKVESPPLDVNSNSQWPTSVSEQNSSSNLQANKQSKNTWQIILKAQPAANVRVVQNGKSMGNLSKGELNILVQAGQFQLVGTGVNQAVRIQVINKDRALREPQLNQTFLVEENIQNVLVTP